MNAIAKKTEGSDEHDIEGKKRDRDRIGRRGPGRENAGTGEQDRWEENGGIGGTGPGRENAGSGQQDMLRKTEGLDK